MSTTDLPVSGIAGGSVSAEVRRVTGLDANLCYQCGKCSAGCPMAAEMDLKPHEIIRLVQLDRRERLFAAEAIWLCLTCETCTTRCPNGFDPAGTIDAVRELALAGGATAVPRRIAAFHSAFLRQIWAHGRVFELGLVADYKLKSGALLADVTTVPGMLARGKLTLAPRRIRGIGEVRRIFAGYSGRERST